MKYRAGVVGLVAAAGFWIGADLLACGDKFLVVGRGTRYQRPKNARAASVLIYANPTSGLPAALRSLPVESVLRHEGHRSATVETLEQLSAILAAGRFDIVLADAHDASAVEKLFGADPNAPVVLAFCDKASGQVSPVAARSSSCDLNAPPKERSLLDAIDQAVERRDKNARKAQSRS